MVSERRKLKDQFYYARSAGNFKAASEAKSKLRLLQRLSNDKLVQASEIVIEKKLIKVDPVELAQREERDRQWKLLCVKNKNLIIKNPEARCSKVNPNIRRAVEFKNVCSLATEDHYFKMNPDNFHEPLKVLLNAEEAYDHIDMRKFDQKRKRVRVSPIPNAKGETLFEYDLIGMSKGQPKLIVGDTVILDDGREPERFEIERVEDDTLVFKRASRGSPRRDISKTLFDISFVQSGSSYDRYTKNLDTIKESKQVKDMLFEPRKLAALQPELPPKIDICTTSNTELAGRLSKCNKYQRQAIKNIIEATCRPNLYILFGPPGTGKTFTIVETVIQLYQRNPTVKILICSSSNNCVDDLATILHKSRQIDRIVRLSSIVHYNSLDAIPIYFVRNHRKAKSCRVVITTNMMASKLLTSFDYILVDEAGHAHIPETMLPLAKLKQDGCFILAGDPKQLGPVIKCYEVQKLGLGVSLLERMFKFDIYARNKKTGYNPKFITKLINSYRCDPRILNLCNRLFYNDDLNCLGRTPPSIMRMLKIEKPLVFAETNGVENSPGYSTSRQNRKEVEVCLDYLFLLYKMGVSPEQVGIITPYILQRQLLIEKFEKRLKQVKPLLDQRFKISPVQKKSCPINSTNTNQTRQLSRGLHTDRGLDDVNFLEKALLQLKLNAQAKQQSQIVSSENTVSNIDWQCKIDTVDAFQGNEREFIIISTVRTPNKSGTITKPGFLTDAKRFNVAISRAKWSVIVVGHPAVMNCCKIWKEFKDNSCSSQFKF